MWILAAHDRGPSNGSGNYKCRGCYQQVHKEIDGSWENAFRNPYILLVTFSIILCVGWIGTGILGIIVNNESAGEWVRMCIICST